MNEKNTGLSIETCAKEMISRLPVFICSKAAQGYLNMTVKELNTFKKITGGDLLYAQRKGKPQFSFICNGIFT